MPRMIEAHIDRALTNISVAYLQDASSFVADKVFPIVPVRRQSDVYYQYSRADFFRDEARVRGSGTESAGGDYGVEAQDPYHCRKHAFHKDVTTEERANYDEPLDADIDATIFISQKMLIRREVEWAQNYFRTGVWTTQIQGSPTPTGSQILQFDNEASDPIGIITRAGVQMASQTAYRPNKLVLSPFVYNALKNHPDILDRIKYTQKGIVTTDLLATLFEVDQVLIAWGVVNSARKGVAESNAFIMGKNALLCYANPRPALRQPSAGYIFAWTGIEGGGAYGNRIIRLPMDLLGLGTERVEGEIAFDCKVISNDLGVFFYDLVA